MFLRQNGRCKVLAGIWSEVLFVTQLVWLLSCLQEFHRVFNLCLNNIT